VAGGVFLWHAQDDTEPLQEYLVTTDTVTRAVSASGVTDTNTSATLGFPFTGTIASINVTEGEEVPADAVLATLRTDDIDQQVAEAESALVEAIARQRELLRGVTSETAAVQQTAVSNARKKLTRVRTTQKQNVENARATLLSKDLVATTNDNEEEATPPRISGTYYCEDTGTYTLSIYSSAAPSGYSVRVRGLENDTVPGSFTQPVSFGTCGLQLELTRDDRYHNTTWQVAIPNRDSATYIARKNAYETAQQTASSSIAQAQDALVLATQKQANVVAPTRSEQIAQANAQIRQAEARLERLETQRRDHTLRAPTEGTVTNIDTNVGEVVQNPFLTFLGTTQQYSIDVRIAESDITYIETNDPVRITFDARPERTFAGTVKTISPLPTQIDGAAYFTATVYVDTPPSWLRTGLNADVEIIIAEHPEAVRVPHGYIRQMRSESPTVHVQHDDGSRKVTDITIELIGTDGGAAVRGITPGTTLLAPF
jgi:multidrug resistance efflux pump